VPKVGLLARPRAGGTITSRYLTPHRLHAAHAVTGGICVGAAVLLGGTTAYALADRARGDDGLVTIEHPSGTLTLKIERGGSEAEPTIVAAGTVRTARKLFDGAVFVPRAAWP